MNNSKPNKIDYDYFFSNYKRTKEPEFAIKIMDMILSGKAKVTIFEDDIKYKEVASFKNKCVKCGIYIKPGEPHFFQYNNNWHEGCATQEEKDQSSYYQHVKAAK